MTLFAQSPVVPAATPIPAQILSSDPNLNRELDVLNRETDEELRSEGLLSLAGRQERAGHEEAAAAIYAALEGSSVGSRARERRQALTGEGSNLGARSEVLLRRFVGEATNPAMLLGMTAAGLAFRVTRTALLARSLAEPAGLLTRGLGASASASLFGFAAEGSTFALATRLGNEGLGRAQDWSFRAVSRDIGSSYLLLGGMRASGALFAGVGRAAGVAEQGVSSSLLRQSGMFGGILLGHGLERGADLRSAQPFGVTLLDSLALLLQFNVAGRLNNSLLGAGFRAWENSLDQQAQNYQQRLELPRFPRGTIDGFGLEPALVGGGSLERGERGPENRSLEAIRNEPVYMTGQNNGTSIDQSGINVLRFLKTINFTNEADPTPEIRRWINSQSTPIAVATVEGAKIPVLRMVNPSFERTFKIAEGSVEGQPFSSLLPENASATSFVNTRVMSQLAGATMDMLKRVFGGKVYREFEPTRMPFVDRFLVGSGVYRSIGGKIYAFGAFTALEAPTLTRTVAIATSESPRPPLARTTAASASIAAPALGDSQESTRDHFRRAREALNGGSNGSGNSDPK